MREEQDAMMLVRAELCERLDSLQRFARPLSAEDFAGSIVSIRRLAAAYGLVPVVRLAEALERAVAESGEQVCPTALYLDRLRDAIGCERSDDGASEAMIASVSVRLGA
ncbi:MAG TPA: hypothetical protein VGD19_06895 [Allosphingosinicella sp.]|jgi:hypothetical protein